MTAPDNGSANHRESDGWGMSNRRPQLTSRDLEIANEQRYAERFDQTGIRNDEGLATIQDSSRFIPGARIYYLPNYEWGQVLDAGRGVVNVQFDYEHRVDTVDASTLMLDGEARLAFSQLAQETRAALSSFTAMADNPMFTRHEPQRQALLEALEWLELDADCGDCVEGRCHWGGERSAASAEAAAAGEEYQHEQFGTCGCDRHKVSVGIRHARARRAAAGVVLPAAMEDDR